jgi:plastocyanin
MRPLVFAVCATVAGLPAAAQPRTAPVDWASAKVIEVDVSNYAFNPATLVLRHGVPYRLHFVNQSHGGHDFTAKDFFAQATLDPSTQAVVKDGAVRLSGGENADVDLIAPAPGHFDSHCSHFTHAMRGMRGQIDVE